MSVKNSKMANPSITAHRINSYATRFHALKYLEIGVKRGKTFFTVNMPLKVAVDPNFDFDLEDHAKKGVLYLPVTSDDFFSTFSRHPQASLYSEPDGHPTFDIIFIDGLHTFDQALRDFENSLRFCHQNTLWILDDTVPSDVFSAVPDQRLALKYRKYAGGVGGAWHGDVFKSLFAIHDFHPEISYCTVMDNGNPQTVLWQAPPSPERQPRFASCQEIAALGYLAVLQHADLFLPTTDTLVPSFIGKSLAPASYAYPDMWEKMLYSKIVSAKEAKEVERIRDRDTAITQLRRRLEKMENSFSWRITKPLRWLGRQSRHLRKRHTGTIG